MQTKLNVGLADLQASFAQGLLQFDDALIVSSLRTNKADVADRFAIYRGNMLAIWNKTLTNAYPVISQLVGEEFFEDLARAYGRAHPSQLGDLNAFGAQFSTFLKSVPTLQEYPYMSSVAELEWQVHQAYYAAASREQLSLAAFLHQQGEQVQQAKLTFATHVSLFKSECAAVPIWLAHQASEFQGLPEELNLASYAAVVRPQWRVEVLPLDQAAFQALSILNQGANLEQALEQALQIDEQFDVGQQLQLWFSAGLFSV